MIVSSRNKAIKMLFARLFQCFPSLTQGRTLYEFLQTLYRFLPDNDCMAYGKSKKKLHAAVIQGRR